jgi:hypothetical protein
MGRNKLSQLLSLISLNLDFDPKADSDARHLKIGEQRVFADQQRVRPGEFPHDER